MADQNYIKIIQCNARNEMSLTCLRFLLSWESLIHEQADIVSKGGPRAGLGLTVQKKE